MAVMPTDPPVGGELLAASAPSVGTSGATVVTTLGIPGFGVGEEGEVENFENTDSVNKEEGYEPSLLALFAGGIKGHRLPQGGPQRERCDDSDAHGGAKDVGKLHSSSLSVWRNKLSVL